jgi:hypothetical protein
MLCSMAKNWGRQMRAAVHFAATATVARVPIGLGGVAALICCLVTTPVFATTFVFDETSSSVPGFVVSSSIAVNNTFADLPTVSNINNNGPYPFGDGFALQAFSITVPSGTYTLSDFTPANPLSGVPEWSISPDGILFIDKFDANEFIITGFGAVSTIGFDTDVGGPCMIDGACIATGYWEAVPEPASAMLLVVGLLGSAFGLRLRRKGARAQDRTSPCDEPPAIRPATPR